MKLWYVKLVPPGEGGGTVIAEADIGAPDDQDMVADYVSYDTSLVEAMDEVGSRDEFFEWLGVSTDDNKMIYRKDHLDHLQ